MARSLLLTLKNCHLKNIQELERGFLKYTPCQPPLNVEAGFPDSFIGKPEGNDGKVGIEVILKALKLAGVDPLGSGVVTFRNNLNKIFLTAIEPRDDWAVGACALTGFPALFLDVQESARDFRKFPDSEKFMYYGYKFETLCTGGKAEGAVDSTSESAVVLRSKLNDLDLMVATEVDSHEGEENLGLHDIPDVSSFVEIKTTRLPVHAKQRQNAQRYKYPKWWLQSTLGGVPKIVVGYWDDKGVVQEIKTFETHSLPNQAMEGVPRYMKQQMWKPDQILSFGLEVLMWMKTYVDQDRDCHVEFRYDPTTKLITGALVPHGDLVQRVKAALDMADRSPAQGVSPSE